MANIIGLLREHNNQALLRAGDSGRGALQSGEFGYAIAEQVFNFHPRAGGYVTVTTMEKMALAAAAATSGAKGVGYFPSSGLSSTNLQDALDQLAALVAAGGGGTVLGTGTAGKILKWLNSTTAQDSVLAEASGKINFSGDTVANLYRLSAGVLGSDAGLELGADLLVSGGLELDGSGILHDTLDIGSLINFSNTTLDGKAMVAVSGAVTKNNSNTRQFYGLRLLPAFNPGGSNANTKFDVLSIDTQNTGLTGLTVNLMKLSYGGAEVARMTSAGALQFTGGGVGFYGVGGPDATNYELTQFGMNASGPASINVSKGGTGTYRDMTFQLGGSIRARLSANGNVSLLGDPLTSYYGGGVNVLYLGNAGTLPTSDPTGGGLLYVDSGALKWRGTSGTITPIAPA